jgi:hypothetical protein
LVFIADPVSSSRFNERAEYATDYEAGQKPQAEKKQNSHDRMSEQSSCRFRKLLNTTYFKRRVESTSQL